MTIENNIQASLCKRIETHCKEKNYQVSSSSNSTKIRLDICNLAERTIINVFTTGKIQIQGKRNSLFLEMTALKTEIENHPTSLSTSFSTDIKACTATYDIMLEDIRERIKDSWKSISSNCEITNTPSKYISYRAKIAEGKSNITVTQFINGKLMLQGKEDYFLDSCCDHLEKIAQPSNKDVAARFVSTDQKALDAFVSKYTPDLIMYAEEEVKRCLGDSFLFLDQHDQKWFIASKCLCHSGIVLPEYSPFVMPSSKAFEGFSKKLLIGIGLVQQSHFSTKTANFAILNDKTNPKRIDICTREKYVVTFLERLHVSLDTSRNFMMHSDDSFITKVESPESAISLVNDILKDEQEIFDYFNRVFNLLPKGKSI